MNILYLTPDHLDYLSDQLYSGLCQVLGWESVVDFPYKSHYHDPTLTTPYILQTPGRRYESGEILELLRNRSFDLVVLSAIRPMPLDTMKRLRDHVPLPPAILVDGDDGPDIQTDLFNQYHCRLYFKREYRWSGGPHLRDRWERWRWFGLNRDLVSRTYPLQFSAVVEALPSQHGRDKDVDVSFFGLASHRQRIRALQVLREANDLRVEGRVFAEPTTRQSKLVQGLLPVLQAKLRGDPYATPEDCRGKQTVEEYFATLRRSKIGLSVRGAGFDTLRYWEVVASKTLLISEPPSIYIPNNFEHGKHAVFCRPDFSDLVELVRTYVRDDKEREAVAAAGYDHLMKYHTCAQRANQVLDVCRQRL